MVFHESYYDAIRLLPDDKRLEAYDALMRYEFEDEEPEELSMEVELIFTIIRPLLDAAEVKRQNGKKGGRPKNKPSENEEKNQRFSNEKTKGFQKSKASKEKESISEVKESEEKSTRARANRPSLEELKAYCSERSNGVDPETFFDFYEAKGWKVGNAPMKDWKAAVRTWERRKEYPAKKKPDHGFKGRDYDFDKIEEAMYG